MIDVTDRNQSVSKRDQVSLEFKLTSIKTALDTFLQGQGVNYVIDQSVDPKATISSLKLQNMPFEQALKVMLKSVDPPLTYNKEGDTYHISTQRNTSPEDSNPSNKKPNVPIINNIAELVKPTSISEDLDQVTLRIPPMSIKEAIEKIETGWTFKDKLGDTQMPGASFYRFPKDAAVSMLLISAGLVPPTNDSKLVTTKGKADLSSYIQWNPQKNTRIYDFANRRGGFGMNDFDNAVVAIGAHKTNDKKGEWLYTILASKASQTDLLDPLFSITGRSYLRAESGSGYGGYGGSAVSAQLYDLTLDDSLDVLLPMMGLFYGIQGSDTNPTYVISTQNLGLPKPPSSSKAGASK
jgi:hypothetical protein